MTNEEQQEHPEEEGFGARVRKALAPGPNPEERLDEILAERRRELDEHAARLHSSIEELERREELIRDSRASVERMLRTGTSELESRETELTELLRELAERDAGLAKAEAEVARRRQELGAVELKRAAVEGRERSVEEREERVAELEVQLEAQLAASAPPGEEQEVALVFVPGADYRLVELESRLLKRGDLLEVGEDEFVVARFGRSPLPGDARRCAYVVRAPVGFVAED